MINLLPPEEKNILQREKQYRLALILGTFVLFFLISLSLILFSLRIYINGQVESQKILINLEQKKSQTLEVQNLEKEIDLINQNLSKLNSFYENQPQLTELLEKISTIIPEEIYLTSLYLNPISEEKNKFQISLTGYCPAREILLDFKRRIEAESNFQEVYFPPSNWLEREDIDFSTTFEVII